MKRLLILTLIVVASACAKSSPSPTTPSPTTPSPTPNFGAVIIVTPSSAVRGQPIAFTGKGRAPQGSIAKYTFDFGDSTTFLVNTQSETVVAQHVYAAAGTFSVRLTVTNMTGDTVSASVPIIVSEQ